MSKQVLAIDVGGSKIAYGIIDGEGNITEDDRLAIEYWDAAEIVKKVKFLIKSWEPKVKAVGLGFPGIVNPYESEIVYDENSQKYEINLDTDLPIAMDNDSNLSAIGERWLGAAADVDNFVFIKLGDGIGSGLFLDGHLYRGSHYSSGEIKEIVTSNKNLDCISGYNFPGEFDADDKGSLSFIAEQLSQGIQSIAAVVDPTTIIIGGSRGVKIWPYIAEELREKVKHLNISIQPSTLGADAGLLGAARLALDKLDNKLT
ncbi:MAG: N-acetyl-D-glucosamine kinase GlcNAc kinase [candidate division CPR2 bacterium GW2011_GWC1_39_9]|uniref:N-acetyl-D-glucosamine kinase GlcNAc kinase n=1 Tax=candidate division CPR2 bacterium GW2011_GWC2_39_10 TaxID=1618345 RepID=A0A0G0LQC2_UNCC2|nr:MAG: N-acetyl-D-glucosamine kinase GlcNAc kinase [candidate division CPR2 bacterium GW2011_GWC2_39_10]KKR35950.1 MAG: N-acetyl-D-glucosamine kinase GlcNAc kinase [candidate division CPR2 bacterium GW2011_GWC1_39_9]